MIDKKWIQNTIMDIVSKNDFTAKINLVHEQPIVIDVRDACKTYQISSGGVEALKHISISVKRGEFVGIIGKSGAGKSTLVNMLSGVDTLTSGSVLVNSVSVHDLSENQRNAWRGRHVGIVYQSFELLNQLTVLDNVLLPMDFCGRFQQGKSREYALKLLSLVEIDEHALKYPTAVSGGQQQRVAIARALANDPEIIIADEPTGNLDSQTANTIMALFQQLQHQGKTIVMVTHNRNLFPYFSQIYQIADGELTSWGKKGA